MCGEEISSELQKVIRELLEYDEQKVIITSVPCKDPKPVTFEDMWKVRDSYLHKVPYTHIDSKYIV